MNTSVHKGIRNPEGEAMELKRPGGEMKPANPQGPTRSTLNPMSAKASDLIKREYFWPIAVTTLVAILIFYYLNHLDSAITYRRVKVPMFAVVLTAYLSFAGFFIILKFAGKRPNWWMIALVGVFIVLDLFYAGPFLTICMKFFRGGLLPLLGLPPELPKNPTFFLTYFHQLISAGLMEEVYKAIPTVILLFVGLSQWAPWNERLGVREPIDGIICGAIAGAAFTFIETGFNHYAANFAKSGGHLAPLVAIAPRTLSEFAGHVGYAGYAGYFIGLAALHPEKKWKLIGIGVASAAAVHALWNASDALGEWAAIVPAGLAIVMIGSAILKAREISPNRAQLARSQILDRFARHPAAAGVATEPAPNGVREAPRSETWTDAADLLVIEFGTARVPVSVGARLYERQAPGTQSSRGDGIVAEVNANPSDPGVLGIKNLSNQLWQVTTDKGERRELAPGRSIRIAHGMKVQLGDLIAEVK